jgi:hypothetical protein
MRYTLRHPEGTCTFCKIVHGRRWIGRVTQHADGTWIGVIGKLMVTGHATREAAFDDVVAKHLGYPTADALRAHNARARQGRRLVNQMADALAADVLSGNFSRLDRLGPEGLTLALRGMTRNLRRGS